MQYVWQANALYLKGTFLSELELLLCPKSADEKREWLEKLQQAGWVVKQALCSVLGIKHPLLSEQSVHIIIEKSLGHFWVPELGSINLELLNS